MVGLVLGMEGALAQEEAAPAVEETAPVAEEAAAVAVEEAPAEEEEAPPTIEDLLLTANNIWMMLATGLVFIMHLGFSTLESGLCRSKNTVNILTKNAFIVCIGLVTYGICGFNLMYPGDSWIVGKYLGFSGFGITPPENGNTVDYASGGYTYWTDFLFQGMFAATCATIVSGAVAERIKLSSFMFFSVIYVAVVYPITGSWKWGYGFLNDMGFYDFAGSTLVHSVGGWGALVGVMLLGPRLGKYSATGEMRPIPGHSMPLVCIGVFLLWLGWFGFNGGSVLSANPASTSRVLVTTSLAAAAGGLGALYTSWIFSGKPDFSMCMNGILAGLVGITAGADQMWFGSSLIIGAIAGIIVYFAVVFFDKVKLDDPVGALSVHLVCGVWGTLAVGLFGDMAGVKQLTIQAIGVAVYGVACFVSALVIFLVTKAIFGLRVSEEEETEGLDYGEHGANAYPNFEVSFLK
jgi:Amt family ammonium transporter